MNANTSKCRANAIGFPSQGNRSEKVEVLAIGPNAHRKFKGQVPSMSVQFFDIYKSALAKGSSECRGLSKIYLLNWIGKTLNVSKSL